MLSKRYIDNAQFRLQAAFMSDGALVEMLDARPIVNSDVVLINREKRAIYLPTRISRPAEGLWFIGGARKAGETALETIVRRVSKETGAAIVSSRFEHVGIIEYIWSYRKELPHENGRHDINWIFALEPTVDEMGAINTHLHEDEYDTSKGLREFGSISQLREAGARDIVLDVYSTLFDQGI